MENKAGLKHDERGGRDETPANVKFVPRETKVLFHFVADISEQADKITLYSIHVTNNFTLSDKISLCGEQQLFPHDNATLLPILVLAGPYFHAIIASPALSHAARGVKKNVSRVYGRPLNMDLQIDANLPRAIYEISLKARVCGAAKN